MMNNFIKFNGFGALSNSRLVVCSLSLLMALSGCASYQGTAYKLAQNDKTIFEKKLREKQASGDADVVVEYDEEQADKLQVLTPPVFEVNSQEIISGEEYLPDFRDVELTQLSFNNMPIRAFINEVFGNQLNLNFLIEPAVQKANDLISLRIVDTVEAEPLYRLALQTLNTYGVTMGVRDGIMIFTLDKDNGLDELPVIITGRALPEVPASSRPVYVAYPLTAVRTGRVRSWVSQLFGDSIKMYEDMTRNFLLIRGKHNAVKQALSAIKAFDQPEMAGRFSRLITPSVPDINVLINDLINILSTQGFDIGLTKNNTAIRILPINSSGQVMVFTQSEDVANYVVSWVETLQQKQNSQIDDGIFSFQVQNTQAQHIVDTLSALGITTGGTAAGNRNVANNDNAIDTPRIGAGGNAQGGRFAVDDQLNTILFTGAGKEWMKLLKIIKQLDKPAPTVMIEVIIAEIQLNDSQNSGVEWLANSVVGGYGLSFSTLGGLGLGASGFSLNLDSAGQTRAVLNAFYNHQKANIRSRPRIMVKSGNNATIDVGNEVPVITSNSQSTTDSNSPVIQNVSYRNTGVTLSVKPTVHASGVVDIEIDQNLSEATATTSSSINSPTILNRSLSTTVALRDGGSVLLGGLISSSTSNNEQGVPILGKLPLVGKLFSTNTQSQDRTELMIMIVPYIINSFEEAEQLSDDLQLQRINKLSELVVPSAKSNQ